MSLMEEKVKWGVLVEDIPPEGLHFNFENLEEIQDVRVLEPFSGTLFVRKRGLEVLIQGHIKGTIELKCDLCLDSFPFKIDSNFEVLFLPKASLNFEGERELSAEDLEVSFYENSFIDFINLIHEEIILGLPFRNICREDCKGLCGVCGANLNREKCSCKPIKKTSPFAVLKGLKIAEEKYSEKEV